MQALKHLRCGRPHCRSRGHVSAYKPMIISSCTPRQASLSCLHMHLCIAGLARVDSGHRWWRHDVGRVANPAVTCHHNSASAHGNEQVAVGHWEVLCTCLVFLSTFFTDLLKYDATAGSNCARWSGGAAPSCRVAPEGYTEVCRPMIRQQSLGQSSAPSSPTMVCYYS